MDPAALQVLHHCLRARQAGKPEQLALPGADLRGAQLMRADLIGADLAGAGLDHSQLAGAKLGKSVLRTALLRWADLAGADLTAADLREADLSWARLEGVCLADADLRGASVVGAIGEPSTVAGARIDRAMARRSRLPDEEVIQLWQEGAIIEDLEGFSERVQAACAPEVEAELVASDPRGTGPAARQLADAERELRRQLLEADAQNPPSARFTKEIVRLSLLPATRESLAGPLSVRSLKLVAGILTPAMLDAPEWKEGDKVMGATLEKLVGQGSAARVWRARTGGGETVAVKLFDASRARAGLAMPAFRRGVQMMNRLTRMRERVQGVVLLRACARNKLGMVMDLAANGSAADLPALDWRVPSKVKFFDRLSKTVQSAHAVGALHRCLKPSNILLDADLEPYLTDFDMVDLPTLVSESPDAGGYAAYAAPEELLGQGTQSPTADIYSLGRFLYFLLSGREPDEPPAELPALAALRGEPPGLVRIVRKCTMRSPEARYQWVSELSEDLARYEEADAVGLGADVLAPTFLPARLSALPHATPWLRAREGGGSSAPPARAASEPAAAERDAPSEPSPAPPRRLQRLVGGLGLAALLFAVAGTIVGGRSLGADVLVLVKAVAIAGGASATLLLPLAAEGRRWKRLLLAAAVAALLAWVDVPGLFAPGAGGDPNAGWRALPP
jgi:hypothetical protein